MASILKTVNGTIKNWWIPLLVGIIFVVGGVYTFIQPETAYVALTIVFTASFIVAGIAEIIFSISNRDVMDNWGWMLVFGIITTIAGVLLAMNPSISAMTLPFYVGFVVLFRSVGAITYSLDLKDYGILDWGNLMAVGILGVIFSFILLWNPYFAGMSVVIWTGLALIFAGIFSIYLAFRLRSFKGSIDKATKPITDAVNEVTDRFNEVTKNISDAVSGDDKKKK